MKKIIIIGCPGSGKSTLAVKLKEKLNVPVLHLDSIYHIDNAMHITREQLTTRVAAFAGASDSWIIDGNYISTLEQRIMLADTIIWLNIDTSICLANVIARTRQPRGVDMAAGFDNTRLDDEFLQKIKDFNANTMPKMQNLYQQIENFLQNIKEN